MDVVQLVGYGVLGHFDVERQPHQKDSVPAEVLPIVVVLSNLVHFFLGLPILFAFLIYYGKVQATLVYLPAMIVLQLFLTLGICFFVSALAVHFRRRPEHHRELHDALVLR